jgi:alpha-beta hydrolase superfamily lysophospholipase
LLSSVTASVPRFVAAWIHDYAPRVRAAVLATPAFRIRLYLPFAIPALRLTQKLGVMRSVSSYVKARVLTHDPARTATP